MPTDNAGNTLGTARDLSLTSILQPFSDRVDTLDTNDYYRFTLTSRSCVNFTLNGLSANADLQLLNSSSTVLQSSQNSDAVAELLTTTLDPGTYYIRVFPGSSSPGTDYTLNTRAQTGSQQIGLFWRDYSGGIDVMWHMGGSNNTTMASASALNPVPTNWRVDAIADFNQDGNPDLVWRDYTTGNNAIWFMGGSNNDTLLSTAMLTSVSTNWRIEGVADFNGDNRPDLVWREYTQGGTVLWFMGGTNNTTIASTAGLSQVSTNWSIDAVADINGDNRPDLVWREYTQGATALWFMGGTNNTTIASTAMLNSVPISWHIEGVADFNGDNRPDLVWRDYTNGNNALWFMGGTNNTALISSTLLAAVPSNWRMTPFTRFNQPTIIDGAGNSTTTSFNIGNLGGNSVFRDRVDSSDSNDYYQFTLSSASNISLLLNDLSADADLQLFGSNGTLIQGSYNSSSSTESLSTTLSAGTYYVRVYQYSGSTIYALNLSVVSPQPDLIIQSLTVPGAATVGNSISISAYTKNNGQATAGYSYVRYWLSDDAVLNTSTDRFLGYNYVNALNAGSSEFDSFSFTYDVAWGTGTKYIFFEADGYGYVSEGNETNNTAYQSITINALQPDLIIQSLTVPGAATVGNSISISAYTKNNGQATAGYSYVRYWLSDDAVLNTSTDRFLGYNYVNALNAGSSEFDSFSFTYDAAWGTGTKYIFFEADGYGYVSEGNETNNTAYQSITINAPQPDLIIQSLTVPGAATVGNSISISAYTKNNGQATAGYSYVRYWLSDDAVLNTSTDRFLGYNYVNALNAGSSEFDSFSFTYDVAWGTGTKYIFFEADGYGYVSEGNETNNTAYQSITINAPTVPTTYLPFDASKVFSLNSNLGANHTIYLDFNSHVTTNTYWNTAYRSGDSIVTSAFDMDGNTSSFSTAELETIWRIWQRVAEDFIPFNVNVTTALPSTDQLIKSGSSDTQWGIRVVIGGDNSWYGSGGGVAYRDSFNWDSDTPAFVFSQNLNGLDKAKTVAEAISHEVGHTLGLSHDGNSTSEYYYGHGTGVTGWAPIMGVGYSQEITQWSRGEYANASNLQDDLYIITTQNGFGYRADDYGNQLSNAALLQLNGSLTETYGIIETNTDVDCFSFTSSTGRISLNIKPFVEGPNLDILATLYNSSGQVIQVSNPTEELLANFNLALNPGLYYLSIKGTGKGDVSTGYSAYGSLGQYSITGAVV